MSSVREIVEAGADAGVRQSHQLTALVALVQIEDGGRAEAVPEHVAEARRYPQWSVGDLARYGPRIALLTPQVLTAMGQLGIEGLADETGERIEEIADPIMAVAEEPLRWLAWLQDPGTVLRLAKVLGGSLLIIGGAWAIARAEIGGKVAAVAGQVLPVGKVAKVASAASAAKGS